MEPVARDHADVAAALDKAALPIVFARGGNVRAAVGASVFWTTPIGPLRFNFAKALVKEDYDKEQPFDLTISTKF